MSISINRFTPPALTGEDGQNTAESAHGGKRSDNAQDPQHRQHKLESNQTSPPQVAPQESRRAAAQPESRAGNQSREQGENTGRRHPRGGGKNHDAKVLSQLNRIVLVLHGDAKKLDIANKKNSSNPKGIGDGQISWSDIQARITTADDALRKQLQSIDRDTFDKLRGDHQYLQLDELKTAAKAAARHTDPVIDKPLHTSPPVQGSHRKGITQALNISGLRNHFTTIDREGVLTTEYPKGSGAGATESSFSRNISQRPTFPAEEMELHYRMKPQPGFDWAKGGKIPGLLVGEGRASGGHYSSTASSARLMWQKDGSVIGYVYPMNGTRNPDLNHGKYGAGVFNGQGLQLKAGEWNDIRVRVKLNSVDGHRRPRRDGELEVTVNGKSLVLSGVQWRIKDETKITKAILTTFFGGPDVSPKNQTAKFKNFEVTKLG